VQNAHVSSGHLVKNSILTIFFYLNTSLDKCLSEVLTHVHFSLQQILAHKVVSSAITFI